MRITLAGIAGGIAMFIWSFCSHSVLPLGEVGALVLISKSIGEFASLMIAEGFNHSALMRLVNSEGYEDRSSDIRKLFLRASGLLLKELHRIGDKVGLFTNKIINSEQLESLSIAVDNIRREFKVQHDLDLSWEETIDRVIKYYPQKRLYLERLREDGPVHRC